MQETDRTTMGSSSTKNASHISSFDSLSSFWWDRNNKSYKVLHEINKIRVKYLKEKVFEHFCERLSNEMSGKNSQTSSENLMNHLSIIDIGCGGGILSSSIAKYFNKVVAIDASLPSIEEARLYASRHEINNVDYINATPEEYVLKNFSVDLVESVDFTKNKFYNDLSSELSCHDLHSENLSSENLSSGSLSSADLPNIGLSNKLSNGNLSDLKLLKIEEEIEEKKFDIVVSFETLEHVDNLELFIKSCAYLVKKDGLILFSTINRSVKSYLLAIFLAENILKWIPKGMHEYKKLVRPSEINDILEKNSFKIAEMKGLSFDLFNRKWLISDEIDVNYFMKIIKN